MANEIVTISDKAKKELESLMMSDRIMEEDVHKIIRTVLLEARDEMLNYSSSVLQNDPRQAYKAIRHTVYKQILGGNINILRKKRAGSVVAYSPTRKLDQNPHQRGGNRRPRGVDTERIDGYYGSDRGFILRFLNVGTNERTTRYGSRGSISARNWFGNASQRAMEQAAENLAIYIDKLIESKVK